MRKTRYRLISTAVHDEIYERFMAQVKRMETEAKRRISMSEVVRSALVSAGFDMTPEAPAPSTAPADTTVDSTAGQTATAMV